MTIDLPFSSIEVRWFWAGGAKRHPELADWFETSRPFRRSGEIGQPAWQHRRGDAPDVYLLVPGHDSMGVKWREGELQIKGRIDAPLPSAFGNRHGGVVERWIKWSYPDLPAGYRALFSDSADDGLERVSVHKRRALRTFDMGSDPGDCVELPASTRLAAGIDVELADIELAGQSFTSLGFEAFPGDAGRLPAFTAAVTAFLAGLAGTKLPHAQSKSYPAWLASLQRSPV